MGFQIDYIEAIEDLIQIIFEKMFRPCRYCELTPVRKDLVSPIPNTCLYYGRKGSQECKRENCPLLKEEE